MNDKKPTKKKETLLNLLFSSTCSIG